jgi:hypothetical protein
MDGSVNAWYGLVVLTWKCNGLNILSSNDDFMEQEKSEFISYQGGY